MNKDQEGFLPIQLELHPLIQCKRFFSLPKFWVTKLILFFVFAFFFYPPQTIKLHLFWFLFGTKFRLKGNYEQKRFTPYFWHKFLMPTFSEEKCNSLSGETFRIEKLLLIFCAWTQNHQDVLSHIYYQTFILIFSNTFLKNILISLRRITSYLSLLYLNNSIKKQWIVPWTHSLLYNPKFYSILISEMSVSQFNGYCKTVIHN